MTEAVIKAAKKSLKRQDSGQMKLKELAKAVTAKVNDDNLSVKQVKQLIQESTKFHVDTGKLVSLKRKRSKSPQDATEELEKAISKQARTEEVPALLASSTVSDVENWRKANKIVVLSTQDEAETKKLQEDSKLFPWSTFDRCNNVIENALIDQCVTANGFIKPSPIQAQSWPILCSGKDMVGIAETGSGKTLAFALPALSAMATDNISTTKKRSPRMLVLAPTRELAMQSDAVLQEFGAAVQLSSLTVYGGVPKHTQAVSLKKRMIDCIVATPGRIKDLIQDQACDLSNIQFLILDEADRMLDMGFAEDVKFIISYCTLPTRQTAMFSATWPTEIQEMAAQYMKQPIRVYVGHDNVDELANDQLSANKRVKQIVQVIEDRPREARLRQLLKQVHNQKNRVLIFALYKKEAERLEYGLRRDGWNCCSIHGNKNQQGRTKALQEFKDGTCPLLIATDVAARGLDIPNVEVVINYTFPLTIEDYIHRIGRTGRAGKTGTSYTFFQPTDKSHAGELQQVLKQVNQPIPEELAKFGSTIKKKEHKLYGNFGPKADDKPMKQATKITFNYDSD